MTFRITSIIFDLDETLIDREATMHRFLIKQHQRLSAVLLCEDLGYADTVLKFQEGGYASKRDAFQAALTELDQDQSLLEIVIQDFEAEYGTEAISFPDAKITLETLRRSFSLGLITNGRSLGQRNKMKSARILDLFDAIVISEEIGIKKPEPAIFSHCLDLLSVDSHEAAYVGDNPTNDIEPANKIGMTSIWMENSRFRKPAKVDASISTLSALPATIKMLNNRNT